MTQIDIILLNIYYVSGGMDKDYQDNDLHIMHFSANVILGK